MAHSQNVDLKRLLHDSKDKHSQSLFDHLCNILTYIDNNPGDQLVEDFETLSQFLSSTRFTYKQHPPAEHVNNPVKNDKYGFKAYYGRLLDVVAKAPQSPSSFVQDFLETNCDWNIAGYGFQEEDALVINNTLERLAAEHNCDSIRFLGVLRGSQRDYFVIYGRLKHHVQDHLPEDYEPNGKGVNAVTFWVSNDSRHMFDCSNGIMDRIACDWPAPCCDGQEHQAHHDRKPGCEGGQLPRVQRDRKTLLEGPAGQNAAQL